MLNTGRSDLRFFARKFLPACLGVRPTQSCKMRPNLFLVPAGKTPEYYGKKTEGLSLVDTRFAPFNRDSPRPVKKKMAVSPCHPLSLVMEVTMIPNMHSLTRYCERYSWGIYIFFLCSNQPVYYIGSLCSLLRLRFDDLMFC